MENFISQLHSLLFMGAELIAILIEFLGMMIILFAIIKEVYHIVFKHNFNFLKVTADNHFNASLATALEILFAAELLKTITVQDFRSLIIVGVLVILRISMTFLVVWEADHKAKHE